MLKEVLNAGQLKSTVYGRVSELAMRMRWRGYSGEVLPEIYMATVGIVQSVYGTTGEFLSRKKTSRLLKSRNMDEFNEKIAKFPKEFFGL